MHDGHEVEDFGIRPRDVLTMRRRLVDFWESGSGLRWAKHVRTAEREIPSELRQGLYQYPEQEVAMQAAHLRSAECFLVAPEMATLLQLAAPSMPSQKMEASDSFVSRGFAVFGSRINIMDEVTRLAATGTNSESALTSANALLWYPVVSVETRRAGLCICWYATKHLLTEHWEDAAPILEHLGVSRMDKADRFHDRPPLGYMGRSFWGLDEETDDGDESEREDRRMVAAFWTLTGQRLSETIQVPIDRSTRRRCEKAGLVPECRVVRLRRPNRSPGEPTDSSVLWSHRWMVGGHWRNQWLPSREMHRLQWIAPYVKGPGDKPFVAKETVKVWDR